MTGSICPNAVWNDVEEPVVILASGSGYSSIIGAYIIDFQIDSKNNFIISDNYNRRIIKFLANDTSTFTVIGVTNTTLDYYPSSLVVDSNGIVYSAESRVSYSFVSVHLCIRDTGYVNSKQNIYSRI